MANAKEKALSLPRGVQLVRTFYGVSDHHTQVAWSGDGRLLAGTFEKGIKLWDSETGGRLSELNGDAVATDVAFAPTGDIVAWSTCDGAVRLHESRTGQALATWDGHEQSVSSIAFCPRGHIVATGSVDRTVKVWAIPDGRLLRTFTGHEDSVRSIAFGTQGSAVASASDDGTIRIWHAENGRLLHVLSGHSGPVTTVAFGPNDSLLASGSADNTVKLWDPLSGRLIRILEGHLHSVESVDFASDGRLLGSRGRDGTVHLWAPDTGICVAILTEKGPLRRSSLAFHPKRPLLITVASAPSADNGASSIVHLWRLDPAVLFAKANLATVSYTNAKLVLVGDSGVGKTGLGWRLTHGRFKEHASTHGQQFWVLDQIHATRADGAECEAILWDLAGQPDYRLIHTLFLDDADLALALFDGTQADDPLGGVEFWLNQLRGAGAEGGGPRVILVAARADRGAPHLSADEIRAYCQSRGLEGYVVTSALTGEGIDELLRMMRASIPWDEKPATVTSERFKRIKDLVLELKASNSRNKLILTVNELRSRLQKADSRLKFSDEELLAAVGHLANHGYVTRLKTSDGEARVLLAPDLLNNLAASFVLEARRNPKGLGLLEERRLLAGEYSFLELHGLPAAERAVLVDAAASMFLKHHICFRETDPLSLHVFLVFPELINLNKPAADDDVPTEDGAVYTVTGAVENVYSSLVVLLGYTHAFTAANQWRDRAHYEFGNGQICGFRLQREREGELEFVLYFGLTVGRPIRMLFQGLFERFLTRRSLAIVRNEPVVCSNGHRLNQAVVRERLRAGASLAFCPDCGERLRLPRSNAPIQLTRQQTADVDVQRRAADQRSRFEQALFRLKTYTEKEAIVPPACYISYAWGNQELERWVERTLATDLTKAGIRVVLDRWDSARVGASVTRFVERISACDRVVVVGTPSYRNNFEHNRPMGGYVAAAEGDLIGRRIVGSNASNATVLPLLVEGTAESALPALFRGRPYADFREPEQYFGSAAALILSLYDLLPQDPMAAELRDAVKNRLLT